MILVDFLKVSGTWSTGGVLTLGAAVLGCRTLQQGINDGDVAVGNASVVLVAADATGNREMGLYTIDSATSAHRTSVLRSTAGSTNGVPNPAPFANGAAVTIYSDVPAAWYVGVTIDQLPAITYDKLLGSGQMEVRQAGADSSLTLDAFYAYFVGRLISDGKIGSTGSTGNTGGTTPTEALSINTVASPQTVGSAFTVSGTWTGVQPTSLDHASTDNGGTQGSWTTLTSSANGLAINANGTWSYSWTPSNASTGRTLQVRDTSHPSVLSAQSNSYVVNAAAGSTPTAPGAPTIGTATAGDGTASFAATAPSSNGGSAITGYVLTVYKASDNTVVGTFNSTTLPVAATGLTNGTGVYGKIAAKNSAGTGSQSAASNTVTPAAAAAQTSAYTVTPYSGVSYKTTIDASNPTNTYGSLKQIAPALQFNGTYTGYFNVNPDPGGQLYLGWSTAADHATKPPAKVTGGDNGNAGSSVNGMTVQPSGTTFLSTNNLWIPTGAGTIGASLWAQGPDNVPVKLVTVTVTGA
jgi:hypothetical protein